VGRKRFRRSVGSSVLHQCIRPLIGASAPGRHGYQRACVLISGQASTGPCGPPVFACAGKTKIHAAGDIRHPERYRRGRDHRRAAAGGMWRRSIRLGTKDASSSARRCSPQWPSPDAMIPVRAAAATSTRNAALPRRKRSRASSLSKPRRDTLRRDQRAAAIACRSPS
jgi:hypothetical protein